MTKKVYLLDFGGGDTTSMTEKEFKDFMKYEAQETENVKVYVSEPKLLGVIKNNVSIVPVKEKSKGKK